MVLGPDGFSLPLTGLLDTGTHVVLISPEAVTKLALEVRKLQKPKFIDVAIQGKYVTESDTHLALTDYVSFTLSTLDNSWTSRMIRAIVTPGLCTSVLLGLPFLSFNEIVIDCTLGSAHVKGSLVDLLNLESKKKGVRKAYKSHKQKRKNLRNFFFLLRFC